jgi:hypothetical protein
MFVFGSNLAGRHGKGAALYAKQNHGAIYGRGVGPQGDSYAIPTKDSQLRSLPLDVIAGHVSDFIAYAHNWDRTIFRVTAIGTGLAGYTHAQIAPLFKGAPGNCILPDEWSAILETA